MVCGEREEGQKKKKGEERLRRYVRGIFDIGKALSTS